MCVKEIREGNVIDHSDLVRAEGLTGEGDLGGL